MTPRARPTVATLAVLVAGAAALGWETLFQHGVSLALGTSARAAAVTLATMMGGMTAGALLAGRALSTRTVARPLLLYAAIELVVGIAGVAALPLLRALAVVDTAAHRAAPALAPVVESALAATALLPASLLMGATIPVLALVARREAVSLAVLYGANTLGAAGGTLLLAFVLIPHLGVTRATVALAALDVVAALAAFALAKTARAAPAADAPSGPAPVVDRRAPMPDRRATIIAVITGATTFVVEVAAFRALIATLWSTTESFALLLVAVLLPLGIAAPLSRRVVEPSRIGPLLVGAGAFVVLACVGITRVEDLVSYPQDYATRMIAWGGLLLLLLGPAVLTLGLPLPFLLDRASGPRRAGWLYGVNTIGAVVGSLGAAWVLLPALGATRTLVAAGIAVGLAGVALAERGRAVASMVLAIAVVTAVVTDTGVGRTRAPGRIARATPHTLVAIDEGPDVTTAVIERADGARVLLIDGFAATEESAPAHYMAWMGHLPMMLHPAPKDALVICFGTGQTAHAVRLEGPQKLDVVDVNPAVFRFAPFFRTNRGVLNDPRIATHVMDGRAFLRRTERTFDVVTLEPMPPTFAGVNSLYSTEFYALVHARLNDGGILAQWLPFHIVSPTDARAIAASFHAVFPDSALWIDPASGTGVLVGRRGDARDLGATLPGTGRPDLGRSLPPDIVARMMFLLPDGMAEYTRGAPLVTDDNQRLAYGLERIDRHAELLGSANRINLREVEAIARKTRGDIIPSF